MNNDQIKENSLFGYKEGESAADPRFVVGSSGRLNSSRQESLEEVHNLSDEDSTNLARVVGRLRVKPKSNRTTPEPAPTVAPLSIEDAERAILSVFADDSHSTDTLFLSAPPEKKSSSSSKGKGTEEEDPFGLEESSVPTLESNSTAISSQFQENLLPPQGGPFSSVDSPFEKADAVKCTVCDESNIESATYCNRCGSLIKFGLRKQGGGDPISSDATAMSWTPNQELNAYLIAINDDGTEGKRIPVEFMETIMGRETDSPFPTDSFLSPKHAKLIVKNAKLYIQDLDSLNGTFVKLRQEKIIKSGDTFLMGRQVLSFEEVPSHTSVKLRAPDGTRKMGSPATDSSYRLLQIGIGGTLQNVYCLPKSGAQLGRERGDIIFPHDKFMSSRHAQIYRRNDGEFVLADLNSSNGTWIKIWDLTPLETQDYIFMGQQLFRVLIDQ